MESHTPWLNAVYASEKETVVALVPHAFAMATHMVVVGTRNFIFFISAGTVIGACDIMSRAP